ncbi:hypothetical protein ACWCQW_37800 [Streptomyces mirabilis]
MRINVFWVGLAGLDLLVEASRQGDCQEDGLLGEVVVRARVADAPADALAFLYEPFGFVGQVAGHRQTL